MSQVNHQMAWMKWQRALEKRRYVYHTNIFIYVIRIQCQGFNLLNVLSVQQWQLSCNGSNLPSTLPFQSKLDSYNKILKYLNQTLYISFTKSHTFLINIHPDPVDTCLEYVKEEGTPLYRKKIYFWSFGFGTNTSMQEPPKVISNLIWYRDVCICIVINIKSLWLFS